MTKTKRQSRRAVLVERSTNKPIDAKENTASPKKPGNKPRKKRVGKKKVPTTPKPRAGRKQKENMADNEVMDRETTRSRDGADLSDELPDRVNPRIKVEAKTSPRVNVVRHCRKAPPAKIDDSSFASSEENDSDFSAASPPPRRNNRGTAGQRQTRGRKTKAVSLDKKDEKGVVGGASPSAETTGSKYASPIAKTDWQETSDWRASWAIDY